MIQREKLIEKLEYCRSNNMKKLNIIHGIGDGVLQNMVYEVLQGFMGIEYEDHDFSITALEMSWLLFVELGSNLK